MYQSKVGRNTVSQVVRVARGTFRRSKHHFAEMTDAAFNGFKNQD